MTNTEIKKFKENNDNQNNHLRNGRPPTPQAACQFLKTN